MKYVPSELAKVREQRRLKAGTHFSKGETQADVARKFGVSRTAAHVWHKAWKKKGEEGLLASTSLN